MSKDNEENENQSEFGKGLTYCLGLFLAHEGIYTVQKECVANMPDISRLKEMVPGIWFNGASDHVYELQIPDNLSDELKNRLEEFVKRVLDYGHGIYKWTATEDDVFWAIDEAKNLLLKIDSFYGVSTCEAEYK